MSKSRKKKPRKAQAKRPRNLEERIGQAFSHPTRTEIMAILYERCASPSEMVPILNADLSSVSYHTRTLLELGCIEVVDKEPVRGVVKTRYRASEEIFSAAKAWDRLPKKARDSMAVNAINQTVRYAAHSLELGVFTQRRDRSVITLQIDVDEQGWKDANAVAMSGYERLIEINEEATTRRSKGSQTFPIAASLMVFEMPDQGNQQKEAT